MRSYKSGRFLLVMLISLGLLGITVFRDRASSQFEPPHGNLLGDTWLRLTPSEKAYFVEGYRRGSSAGHDDACALFSPSVKEQLPPVSTPTGIVLDRCQGRFRNWPQGTRELVRQIDDFYQRFPSDRSTNLTNLIQNLSDQGGLTIEQIHALANHSENH
jgi:hypothetical protein